MSTFSFAEGAAMFDSTPIENLFLMEYLPIAPEVNLRVYLYARMLALHPELGGDTRELARALRIDEDAVYGAFAYWEQQGLARRLTDRPPTYELISPRAEGAFAANPMERDYYAYRDFNASLQALFGAKVIDSHEYRVANDWLNVLGYDQAAALRLAEYGIATSRSKEPGPVGVFKRMDKLAAAWADRGCRTLEDVERAIAERDGVNAVAQAVLKRFNLRRAPSLDELECVKRWTGEWGYTEQQIVEACEETTKARTPTFAYLDKILKNRLKPSPRRMCSSATPRCADRALRRAPSRWRRCSAAARRRRASRTWSGCWASGPSAGCSPRTPRAATSRACRRRP